MKRAALVAAFVATLFTFGTAIAVLFADDLDHAFDSL